MKKNINILGSCVSRDTFGMSENDGGFHIEKCVTNSSIFSLCSPKLSDEILCSEDDFPNSGHYYQRCAVLDINKNVFDYVNESEFPGHEPPEPEVREVTIPGSVRLWQRPWRRPPATAVWPGCKPSFRKGDSR